MANILFIAIPVFLILLFAFWWTTSPYFKKAYGEKMWSQWTTRLVYWQVAIYASSGITILILFILKKLGGVV